MVVIVASVRVGLLEFVLPVFLHRCIMMKMCARSNNVSVERIATIRITDFVGSDRIDRCGIAIRNPPLLPYNTNATTVVKQNTFTATMLQQVLFQLRYISAHPLERAIKAYVFDFPSAGCFVLADTYVSSQPADWSSLVT